MASIILGVVLVLSGCSKKQDKLEVIQNNNIEESVVQDEVKNNSSNENGNQEVNIDTKKENIDIENIQDSKDTTQTVQEDANDVDNNLEEDIDDEENIENYEDEIVSGDKTEAEECIDSGGIYSVVAKGCYYNGESSSDSSIIGNETDDPKAQKCIDDGGVYNSMLEECFK